MWIYVKNGKYKAVTSEKFQVCYLLWHQNFRCRSFSPKVSGLIMYTHPQFVQVNIICLGEFRSALKLVLSHTSHLSSFRKWFRKNLSRSESLSKFIVCSGIFYPLHKPLSICWALVHIIMIYMVIYIINYFITEQNYCY